MKTDGGITELLARRDRLSEKNLDPHIGALMREFGVADALTGVDYEVFDRHGKLAYRIRRKPLATEQIIQLVQILQKTKDKKRTTKR
jgi:hypothetical protein